MPRQNRVIKWWDTNRILPYLEPLTDSLMFGRLDGGQPSVGEVVKSVR